MLRSIEGASPQNLQDMGYPKDPSCTQSCIIYLLMTCLSAIIYGEICLFVNYTIVYCKGTMPFLSVVDTLSNILIEIHREEVARASREM